MLIKYPACFGDYNGCLPANFLFLSATKVMIISKMLIINNARPKPEISAKKPKAIDNTAVIKLLYKDCADNTEVRMSLETSSAR